MTFQSNTPSAFAFQGFSFDTSFIHARVHLARIGIERRETERCLSRLVGPSPYPHAARYAAPPRGFFSVTTSPPRFPSIAAAIVAPIVSAARRSGSASRCA